MARSALGLILSVSVAVLLPLTGSGLALLTDAVLVWLLVVEAGTVNVTVMLLLVPEATVPKGAVKLLPVLVTVPKLSVMLPWEIGRASCRVRATFWASEGPLLLTVMV